MPAAPCLACALAHLLFTLSSLVCTTGSRQRCTQQLLCGTQEPSRLVQLSAANAGSSSDDLIGSLRVLVSASFHADTASLPPLSLLSLLLRSPRGCYDHWSLQHSLRQRRLQPVSQRGCAAATLPRSRCCELSPTRCWVEMIEMRRSLPHRCPRTPSLPHRRPILGLSHSPLRPGAPR